MEHRENDTRHGWTTPDESREISEAGLGSATADLWYIENNGAKNGVSSMQPLLLSFVENVLEGYETLPCWTIGRLMSLMPNSIERDGFVYVLCADGFGCGYFRRDGDNGGVDMKDPAVYYMNDVGFSGRHAVASASLWLLRNGYNMYGSDTSGKGGSDD